MQRMRSDLRSAARHGPADARSARARGSRGGRARTLRRVHAGHGLDEGVDSAAPRSRRWLLVRTGSIDQAADPRDPVFARPVAARHRLQHLLGLQFLRPPRSAGDRARHLALGDAGPLHGRLLHRGRPVVLRASARFDERHADRIRQPRLRVCVRGPPSQRQRRPAAHVRRGLSRAQARRAHAGRQRDAEDRPRSRRRAHRGRRAVRGLRARALGARNIAGRRSAPASLRA